MNLVMNTEEYGFSVSEVCDPGDLHGLKSVNLVWCAKKAVVYQVVIAMNAPLAIFFSKKYLCKNGQRGDVSPSLTQAHVTTLPETV